MEDRWILDVNRNDVRLAEGENAETRIRRACTSGGRDRCPYREKKPIRHSQRYRLMARSSRTVLGDFPAIQIKEPF